MTTRNVVLTGLPRGGTTLTCRLLNHLPDTVALHEPIAPGRFADAEDDQAVLEGMERFFRRMRRMIRREKVAVSKNVGGKITDHAYEQSRSRSGLRTPTGGKGAEKGKIPLEKELDRNFLLVVKQPALFSSLLPVLAQRFPCYALVRNPLSVLASWNSVDHKVREGHSRGAELYDEVLRDELASTDDRVSRQLLLLSWWYERFYTTLDGDHIIRYEELVSSGGRALSTINPAAKMLNEPLSSHNLNVLYDHGEMRELGSRLLRTEGAYWRFYTRESVERLLEQTR
jgi:Sulfotransferase domain